MISSVNHVAIARKRRDLIGADTPITPGAMDAAAPDGVPPDSGSMTKNIRRILAKINHFIDFYRSGVNFRSCEFLLNKKYFFIARSPVQEFFLPAVKQQPVPDCQPG